MRSICTRQTATSRRCLPTCTDSRRTGPLTEGALAHRLLISQPLRDRPADFAFCVYTSKVSSLQAPVYCAPLQTLEIVRPAGSAFYLLSILSSDNTVWVQQTKPNSLGGSVVFAHTVPTLAKVTVPPILLSVGAANKPTSRRLSEIARLTPSPRPFSGRCCSVVRWWCARVQRGRRLRLRRGRGGRVRRRPWFGRRRLFRRRGRFWGRRRQRRR